MAAKEQKTQPVPPVQTSQTGTAVTPIEPPRYIPETELFKWVAPSRPFKKRGRQFWVTVLATASLLAFILFLAEGVTPVLLIISLLFLYYVLCTVKPEDVEYKITNHGIKIAGKLTPWDFTTRYWFIKKLDSDLLVFETFRFPGKLELVISEKDITKIKEVLQKYLPEEKPEDTTMDKVTNWIAAKLPQN